MKEINDFIVLSKYAGERFDLIQAGGGNTSVKLEDGTMLIKASGFLLSDIEDKRGYSKVLTADIASIVKGKQILSLNSRREREQRVAALTANVTLDPNNRPSIETLLHSCLKKYTLHTHPVVVNIISAKSDWKEVLKTIFKNDFATVAYHTPGVELAVALNNELQKHSAIPEIIFLQNHGLIVTAETVREVILTTDAVVDKIEQYLNLDLRHYKLTNQVSEFMRKAGSSNHHISYISQDLLLNKFLQTQRELFFAAPFCPDVLVYCGFCAAEIASLTDIAPIKLYQERFHELPKILIFDDKIFIIAINVKKAREIEEVLKFHTLVLSKASVPPLLPEEMAYLANWEAENYRQKL